MKTLLKEPQLPKVRGRSAQCLMIAGEASGDLLGAELVNAIRQQLTPVLPHGRRLPQTYHDMEVYNLNPPNAGEDFDWRFFGAGGPRMGEAGVELAVDLTAHAVVGLSDVLRKYRTFRRIFYDLLHLARDQRPDLVILIDYPGFNLRFAKAVRNLAQSEDGLFNNWRPKIVYYVSPQLWAWHSSRARQMERHVDLLLSLFPFEKEWFAQHAPNLKVVHAGHPLLDRYAHPLKRSDPQPAAKTSAKSESHEKTPLIVLLPGSRKREIDQHLPVMAEATRILKEKQPARFRVVLPDASRQAMVQSLLSGYPDIQIQVGQLAETLQTARVALAASGTVTMECAFFGVPTVVIYKTSWLTYQLGRRLVQVPFLAMPNLLAKKAVFPELIQHEATAPCLAQEALKLLDDPARYAAIQEELERVIDSLGGPGASARAAQAVITLLNH